jgi:hypothetical protein
VYYSFLIFLLQPTEIVCSNPTRGMDVCLCECFVLSGRGLCDEMITRPEEFYQLWCVVVCDLENLKNAEALTHVESQRKNSYTYQLMTFNLGSTKVSCFCEIKEKVSSP